VAANETGAGEKQTFWGYIGSVLKHPLFLAVLGAVFSLLLIPQITREWQDRQKEQEIKDSLLEQISTLSTTAVRQGNSLVTACAEPTSTAKDKTDTAVTAVCAPVSETTQIRAAGGQPGEDIPEIYSVLKNSWLIERAIPRSTIITYFPHLYSCWYSYERALADYLGLVTQYPKTKAVRVGNLKAYVDGRFVYVYSQPTVRENQCASVQDLPPDVQARFEALKDATHWTALTYPTWHYRFKQEYAKLGEELEIAMERITMTVASADANGFSHGINIPFFWTSGTWLARA
jgi:hypothetical protein